MRPAGVVRGVSLFETFFLHFIFYFSRIVGTYVKEFVHGDMGRTTPSVSSIFQCQV